MVVISDADKVLPCGICLTKKDQGPAMAVFIILAFAAIAESESNAVGRPVQEPVLLWQLRQLLETIAFTLGK